MPVTRRRSAVSPGSAVRCGGTILLVVMAMLSVPVLARAQAALPLERPTDRPPIELPPLLEEEMPSVLPPVPAPTLGEIQGDAEGDRVLVESVEFEGNTAIDSATLSEAIEPFLGQALAAEGLEALRRRVTEVYIAAGHVASGALIPPQDLREGRLRIRIVEARLTEIAVRGLEHYRSAILRARVRRGIREPLDIHDVEKQLRLLDQDPRIEQINGQIRPGAERGEAILELVVVERDPRQLTLAFDNDESPSVGAYAGRVGVSHDNVTGAGDRFDALFTRTEGLTRISALYDRPIHPSGTRIFVDGGFGHAELVDNILRNLQVDSSDARLGVGLAQTVWHTPADRVDLSVLFERRRSKTELLGSGFSFIPGPQNGRSEIQVVRLGADWTHRGLSSVLAMRSQWTFGTDWLNPTTQRGDGRPGDTPDAIFFSWYGQVRAVHRFHRSGIELGFRGDIQLSDRPLLSLEQFALGGRGSVRGYRRNQIVRDQGFATALDLRLPIVTAADGRSIVALTPFVDFGYVWNQDRKTPGIQTLSGIGAGLDWRPHPQLDFGLEYAHGFRNTGDSNDLSDESVYLRATWRAF